MTHLARLLVIDDLFGRKVGSDRNEDRANLCGHFLLRDVTGDELGTAGTSAVILKPVAEAVFLRGQRPVSASIGDIVENDLPGLLPRIADGYLGPDGVRMPWALVLVDLCFYTGEVTAESSRHSPGVPEGRPADDQSDSYFGLAILDAVTKQFPNIPVVILSSKPREPVSMEFSRRGALGFIARDDEDGATILQEYLDRHGLLPDSTGTVIGTSTPLLLALRAARRAGRHRRNILIRGERGTGKEMIAAYVHATTSVATPYVVVDSGALSPALYASELFGHRRGAFTGADAERAGRIVQADGGDLFLDEVGNMPEEVQIGLLRVVETRRVVSLGATTGKEVDVRFLSATNEQIESKAESGSFRADLLDRIRQGGTVVLPPLRARQEDIPALVRHFVRAAEASIPGVLKRNIDSEAVSSMSNYDWPGNLRELRDAVYNAVAAHPDVEYLVAGHIRLATGERLHVANRKYDGAFLQEADGIGSWSPSDAPAMNLAASYVELSRSIDIARGKALSEAIAATRRVDAVNGNSQIQLAAAVRMLTGDARLSLTQAADFVKRNITDEVAAADEDLAEVLNMSRRIRPSRNGRSEG